MIKPFLHDLWCHCYEQIAPLSWCQGFSHPAKGFSTRASTAGFCVSKRRWNLQMAYYMPRILCICILYIYNLMKAPSSLKLRNSLNMAFVVHSSLSACFGSQFQHLETFPWVLVSANTRSLDVILAPTCDQAENGPNNKFQGGWRVDPLYRDDFHTTVTLWCLEAQSPPKKKGSVIPMGLGAIGQLLRPSFGALGRRGLPSKKSIRCTLLFVVENVKLTASLLPLKLVEKTTSKPQTCSFCAWWSS